MPTLGHRSARGACAALGWLVLAPALAQSPDAAGTATTAEAAVIGAGLRDGAGISPYRLPVSRSPGGLLYAVPPRLQGMHVLPSGWSFVGFAELGLHTADADHRNALFRRSRDPASWPTLEQVEVQARHDADARFFELTGRAWGRDDQALQLRWGRSNDHRVTLSLSDTPMVVSTTARPIWQGIGTGLLALTPAAGVAAGGASTNNAANAAAVQKLMQQTPDTTIGWLRRRGAIEADRQLGDGWTAQLAYALERRKGTKPFGGNEGNGETVEPIDQRTHTLRGQLQYADQATQFNAAFTASLFRNAIDTLQWENPFQHPSGSLRIRGGRSDLAPDNDAYSLRADYARALSALPRGRFSANVELGVLRQNDRLIPPTVTSGIGAPFGTGFNGNFDLWNTTAALGQERAHAGIDTRLVQLTLSAAPVNTLTLLATARHHETRNHTRYTAFNPLTGQYGYIIQDTNASTVYSGSNNVHVRSIPFEGAQDNASLRAEWQLRRRGLLSAEVERETIRRAHRERDRTWEDRVRLGYTDRSFDTWTLRLSIEDSVRRGSDYNSDPYRAFYTESLPDYTVTRANLLDRLHNLEELRKFDLADRRQRRLEARIGALPRDDLDLGLTLQSKTNRYAAAFGRTGTQEQHALHFDLGYLPAATTSFHAWASQQWVRMNQASVADLGSAFDAGCFALPPSCSNAFAAPRSIYPADLAWSAALRDRSTTIGFGVQHDFGAPTLELQVLQSASRSPLGYAFATPAALQSPAFAAQAGNGFADQRYRLRSVDAGLRLPLTPAVALRLTYRHEALRIDDWHDDGLSQGLPVGNRVYLDAGPSGYRVDIVGVFLQLQL